MTSRWIAAHHQQRDAVERYGASITGHPAHLLTIDGFLPDELALRVARFMSAQATYRREYVLFPDRVVEQAEWRQSEPSDRLLSRSVLDGAAKGFELHEDTVAFLQVRAATGGPEYVRFFEAITGLSLCSGNLRALSMEAGDFIARHDDQNNTDRQLAVILYLSPQWQPGFGGLLHVLDEQGQEHAIEPHFNRIVVFETRRTEHFVTSVAPAAPRRLSLTGWY